MAGPEILKVVATAADILLRNGQTTAWTEELVEGLARRFGYEASLLFRWGELRVRLDRGDEQLKVLLPTVPMGIDMNKVALVSEAVEDLRADVSTLQQRLDEITALPPAGVVRFGLMAAAGAAALSVIFGIAHPSNLLLVAASAGAGGWLRRMLGARTANPFVQPFAAAFLAGLIAGFAPRFEPTTAQHLLAVCPCMVLVPGPHFLNAFIDLSRGRIPLGASRLAFALLVVVAIGAGLLAGLSFGGVTLPATSPTPPIAFGLDVIAAGIAVAAFGTFFSMPWRLLPIPIAIGMLAHGARWFVMTKFGANAPESALLTCLIVGSLVSPISERLRVPFAAFGFAAVVSLIPGVLLFRMMSGIVETATAGSDIDIGTLSGVVADGSTAVLVLGAMALGLGIPRLLLHSAAKDH